jgi:hypothetical protein
VAGGSEEAAVAEDLGWPFPKVMLSDETQSAGQAKQLVKWPAMTIKVSWRADDAQHKAQSPGRSAFGDSPNRLSRGTPDAVSQGRKGGVQICVNTV